jgi:hypothetical protein
MIAVLSASLMDGIHFADEKDLPSSLIVTHHNCNTVRGRTLTAAYETPAFRASVSEVSQRRVREVVAPALYTTGGEFIPPEEA